MNEWLVHELRALSGGGDLRVPKNDEKMQMRERSVGWVYVKRKKKWIPEERTRGGAGEVKDKKEYNLKFERS